MSLAGNRRLLGNPQLRMLMTTWTAFQTGTFAHSVPIVVFTFEAGGVAAAGAATVLRVLPGGLLGPGHRGWRSARGPSCTWAGASVRVAWRWPAPWRPCSAVRPSASY
jgi:hypothetical protein